MVFAVGIAVDSSVGKVDFAVVETELGFPVVTVVGRMVGYFDEVIGLAEIGFVDGNAVVKALFEQEDEGRVHLPSLPHELYELQQSAVFLQPAPL